MNIIALQCTIKLINRVSIMLTGIVLSSQSPETTTTFPRRGGTAAGINHVTGFPIIKMHRDAKSRPDELEHFNKIKEGSLVLITGHSDTALDHLTGDYVPPLSTSVQPMSTDWTYKQFRDLILDNGNLKPGDTITIVLWACNAGEGSLGSGAALLGRLFREKQINTRIIGSVASTMRFDGHYSQTSEGNPAMKFVTENGSSDIRIFDFTEEEILEWKNKGPLYVTNKGIEGYNLYDQNRLESLENKKVNKVLEEIFNDVHYKKNIKNQEDLEQQLSRPKMDFILRWSSANDAGTKSECKFFTATYKASDGIHNLRYGINLDGELFSINTTNNNKATPIDILPQGIMATLTHQITHNKELKEQSLQEKKIQVTPGPRRQHLDDDNEIHHHKEHHHKRHHHHTEHHLNGKKELSSKSSHGVIPLTNAPASSGAPTKETDNFSMFVTPLQLQELQKTHGDLTKKKHEKKPRVGHEETLVGKKTKSHVSKSKIPSGENEKSKIDLSKAQRIPVAQRKSHIHRNEFFSAPKIGRTDASQKERNKTTSPKLNTFKGV